MFGDLNAKHRSWNCHHTENKNGKTVFNYIQNSNSMIIAPNEPTIYPDNGSTSTIIDIGINKNVSNINDPIVKHELSSDHCPVLFTIGLQHKIITNK